MHHIQIDATNISYKMDKYCKHIDTSNISYKMDKYRKHIDTSNISLNMSTNLTNPSKEFKSCDDGEN